MSLPSWEGGKYGLADRNPTWITNITGGTKVSSIKFHSELPLHISKYLSVALRITILV